MALTQYLRKKIKGRKEIKVRKRSNRGTVVGVSFTLGMGDTGIDLHPKHRLDINE